MVEKDRLDRLRSNGDPMAAILGRPEDLRSIALNGQQSVMRIGLRARPLEYVEVSQECWRHMIRQLRKRSTDISQGSTSRSPSSARRGRVATVSSRSTRSSREHPAIYAGF